MNGLSEQETEVSKPAPRFVLYNEGKREQAIVRLVAMGEAGVRDALKCLANKNAGLPASLLDPVFAEERAERIEIVHKIAAEIIRRNGDAAIAPLVQALRDGDNKTREQAAHFLKCIGTPAIEPLLALLHHENSDVCAYAVSALSDMEDERATLVLCDALRRSIQSKKAANRAILKSALLQISIMVALGIVVMYFFKDFAPYIGMIGSFTSGGAFADATQKLRRNAVSGLVKSATPQMVGAFAACLEDRDKEVRRAAGEALKRLLPQVQASDKQHIALAETNILLKHLGGKDVRLTLAILKALEQIGDEKALPKVEALANNNAAPVEVMRAAQECLPFLRTLAEQSRQAQTLLRASEATHTPDTLLRAASGASSEKPEQLLRPQL